MLQQIALSLLGIRGVKEKILSWEFNESGKR
jgi:hypothetical protein